MPPDIPLKDPPLVSILVPARNEEKNIARCLESLIRLNYPNYEILVIDDRSTDKTLAIAQEFEKKDPRIRVLHLERSESGWSGKNYALHRGAALARGDWFLFTDADVHHYPESLTIGLVRAREKKLGVLTLLSQLECRGLFENLIQPIASGLMLLWYPPKRLNDPEDLLGFANGQYLLIQKDCYWKLGTHEAVKEKLLEDVALSERAKELKIPFEIAVGTYALRTRMYRGLRQSWNGWKRIFLHLAERDLKKISLFTVGYFVLGVLPFLLFLTAFLGNFSPPLKFLTVFTLLFVILIRFHLNHLSRQPRWSAFLYPFGALLIFGMLVEAVWESLTDKKTHWRGSHY
jgi:chlorobactene glucosyltransferase